MTNREKLIVMMRGASSKAIVNYVVESTLCDFCIYEKGSPECKNHACQDGVREWLNSEVDEE